MVYIKLFQNLTKLARLIEKLSKSFIYFQIKSINDRYSKKRPIYIHRYAHLRMFLRISRCTCVCACFITHIT